MKYINKKVCMIGDFAVGKTSLVARFVKNVYDEKYLTTVGVKIDTKEISITDSEGVKLVLWDIAGEDRFNNVRLSYLKGAAAFIFVADGTRPETLETALQLKSDLLDEYGDLPFVLLINKADDAMLWDTPESSYTRLVDEGLDVFKTSAKTGENVEDAFECLSKALVAH